MPLTAPTPRHVRPRARIGGYTASRGQSASRRRARALGARVALCIGLALTLAGCASAPHQDPAFELLRQDDFTTARAAFEARVDQNPYDTESHRGLGEACLGLGDLDCAERSFREALNLAPSNGRAAMLLGQTLEARGERDAAIEAYAQVPPDASGDVKRESRSRRHELVREKASDWASERIGQESALTADPELDVLAIQPVGVVRATEEFEGFGDALSEFIVQDLTKVQSLTLVERTQLDAILRELELARSGAVDPNTAPRVGKLIGAGRVVTGSVVILDEHELETSLFVTNVPDASLEDDVRRKARYDNDEFFAMQNALVFDILRAIGYEPTQEERILIDDVPTRSIGSFLAFGQGLAAEREGRQDDAREAYRRSLEEDPTNPLAIQGFTAVGGVEGEVAMTRPSGSGSGSYNPYASSIEQTVAEFDEAGLDQADATGDLASDGLFGDDPDDATPSATGDGGLGGGAGLPEPPGLPDDPTGRRR